MSSRRTTAVTAGAAVAAWSLWLLGLVPGAAVALAEDPAVDLGGSPLPGGTGSTDPAHPTTVEAGLWADTLGDANTDAGTHQFRYTRTMANSTLHVGVIAATTDPEGDQVEVDVALKNDNSCGSDNSGTYPPTWQGPYGAAVVVAPTGDDDIGNPCVVADALDITVSRGSSSSGTDLPIALKIVEEAPALGTDALPEAAPSPTYHALSSEGSADLMDGSTSFDEAPVLKDAADGAALVRTELSEGEVQLFRVPLSWGQSLTVTAALPGLTQEEEEALVYVTPEVRLAIIDPIRNSFSDGLGDGTDSGGWLSEGNEFGIGVPPVRYLNRRANGLAAVPGDYWIAVISSTLSAEAERDEVDIPVELRVAVEGDVEEAPSYVANVLGPGNAAGPEGYTPEEPFLVGGTDDFAAAASGNPAPPDDADGDGSWWTTPHLAGLGLGGVSLLLCIAGATGLVRRLR